MKYTYKEIIEKNYKALDLFPNLKDFLKKDLTLSEIIQNIELDIETNPYNKKELIKYLNQEESFFKGDIFNWLSQDEFMEYCQKKFPEIKWQSELVETYWIASGGDIKCN